MVAEPSKVMFLLHNTVPQSEDTILLYIGYHNIILGQQAVAGKLEACHLQALKMWLCVLEHRKTGQQEIATLN